MLKEHNMFGSSGSNSTRHDLVPAMQNYEHALASLAARWTWSPQSTITAAPSVHRNAAARAAGFVHWTELWTGPWGSFHAQRQPYHM